MREKPSGLCHSFCRGGRNKDFILQKLTRLYVYEVGVVGSENYRSESYTLLSKSYDSLMSLRRIAFRIYKHNSIKFFCDLYLIWKFIPYIQYAASSLGCVLNLNVCDNYLYNLKFNHCRAIKRSTYNKRFLSLYRLIPFGPIYMYAKR